MIHLRMGAFIEELADPDGGDDKEGINLIISDYDDETVVIHMGNSVAEVDKKTFMQLVSSLEYKK